ncbi:hypothetical protein OH76DRAFT_1486173 [Lentinus brumalis]|uniref:Uncharacterized protein n=1 Tax=Lentinus brumalis TaxID=2498619 RepID=A0A371CZI3_9APHY|nr:hypothetical protein OH76DRAFT_1486173 [Polyporus brumalis]
MSSFQIQYPISDARSEPIPEQRPSTGVRVALPAVTPVPRELSPGCMSDGTISANHPAVRQFVWYTARAVEGAEAAHAAKPENVWWHVTDGHHASWWRAEKAGNLPADDGWGAGRRLVERVLNLEHDELSLQSVQAVFVLGALTALARPSRAAFWAFWGENSWTTTASLVDEVFKADPALITKPENATWDDKQFGTACVVRKDRLKWLPSHAHPSERRDTQEAAEGDAGTTGGHTRVRRHTGLLDADVPFGYYGQA